MLVFIPRGSGLKIPTMKVEFKNATTNQGLHNLRVLEGVHIPYKITKVSKQPTAGVVYRIQGNPKDIKFKGVTLQPNRILVVGNTNLSIYIYMLAPLTDLPMLI